MRSVLSVTIALALFTTAGVASAAQEAAPDGELVYRQHCASCHEGSMPRLPTREMLRQRTPEDVEIALSTFTMRRQGAALTSAERRAVSEYVTGRPPGSYRDPLEVILESAYCSAPVGGGDPLAGPAWNGWGAGLRNTRFQSAEAAGLGVDDVPRLTLKWAFGFPGVSASGSQASVVGGRVFVGSRNGLVYALGADTGCIDWIFEADGGVRSAPSVGPHPGTGEAVVYFGDAFANVYAVDVASGDARWKVKVDDHGDAMITGAPALHDGRLYVPVSSFEEGSGAMPVLRVLHVHRERRGPRRRRREPGLEDAHHPGGTATDRAEQPGHAALGPVRRRHLGPRRPSTRGATGSTSPPATATPSRPRRRATPSWPWPWTPGASSGRSRRCLGDAWNIACFETTPRGTCQLPRRRGSGLRLRELPHPHHGRRRARAAPRRPEVGRALRPRPGDRRDLVGDAGRRRRHPRRHRVGLRHRRRADLRRELRGARAGTGATPAASPRSGPRTARRSGTPRRSRTPAARARAATPASPRPSPASRASSSRGASTATCAPTTPPPAASSGTSTPSATSRRSTACRRAAAP